MSETGTELTITEVDGGFELAGEVDAQTSPDLQTRLNDHLAVSNDVRLGVSAVTFMDSSALHVLLAATEARRSAGGELVLASPTATVRRLLEISNLADHFTIDAS